MPPSTSVRSNETEKSHQRISNDALPAMRSGSGPSSSPLSETLNRFLLPRLSCTLARNSARKWNGNSWISTSKPMLPATLNPHAAA